MSKTKLFSIFSLLILVAVIVIPRINATKDTTIKYNSKKHTLYQPKNDSIREVVTLAGSISSSQIVNLRFQNSGKLVWVGVKVGDKVHRGQAIASLDKTQLKKNLTTQFNNYQEELSQFNDTQDQYKTTREKFLVTDTIQRILDRTQYSLNNSVITYEITDMAIQEATLISPIDGVVVNIEQPVAGINITPATATFTIINPKDIYFKSEIDQETVIRVKEGQGATIRLDSFSDHELESKINYIAYTPISGQTSTVYEIRFILPTNEQSPQYRIGMDGDADIILSQNNDATVVPTSAVYDDNGQKYVYILSGKELRAQNITTGIENDDYIEIRSGLEANDQVAIIQK
ncbi:efflux RND transporter periplasmic adaptor subunit [Candidatus Shapirobacteria bacterium]|nr:efflux RND transporter periplasmic adaptor subunit [Candidatus Shapirobacteria bacterium]